MFQWPFSTRGPNERVGLSEDVRDVATRSKETAFELNELRVRLDRLLRVNQALWELLKSQHGWKDEQLQKEIGRLEAASIGAAGAEPASAPPSSVRTCKDCQHTVSRRHSICIYCGGVDLAEAPGASPVS